MIRASRSLTTVDHWQSWRWAFFGLLGTTSLVKGTGFGAALVLSVVAWCCSGTVIEPLAAALFPAGWILVAVLTLTWPLAMIMEHGFKVIELWMLHVTQRISTPTGHGLFAGESWCEYGLNILGQGFPGPPWPLIGASRSLRLSFWRIVGHTQRDHEIASGPSPLVTACSAPGLSRHWCWYR